MCKSHDVSGAPLRASGNRTVQKSDARAKKQKTENRGVQ